MRVFAVGAAGHDHRDQVRPVVRHPGQVGAIGAEQALGLLDDPFEDHVGLAQGRDPCGDVAQRAFRLGAERDRLPRAFQLLDQPGVGDRDRGLVGQAAEDRLVDRVERVALVAVDLDRPERALVADDRGDDQVADAGGDRELVGLADVDEVGGQVVPGRDDPSLGHRPAGQALAQAQAGPAHRRALRLGQPGVVGRHEHTLDRVELVDDRAVGPEQPERLVDDALEQVAGFADGRDPGRDLAERMLGLGATLDDRPGELELLHQVGVADRDRGLGGEGGQDLEVRAVVRAGAARHDRDRADRAGVARERRRDHGPDPHRLDERRRSPRCGRSGRPRGSRG